MKTGFKIKAAVRLSVREVGWKLRFQWPVVPLSIIAIANIKLKYKVEVEGKWASCRPLMSILRMKTYGQNDQNKRTSQ